MSDICGCGELKMLAQIVSHKWKLNELYWKRKLFLMLDASYSLLTKRICWPEHANLPTWQDIGHVSSSMVILKKTTTLLSL